MAGADGGRSSGKIVVKVDPDLADLIPGFLENRRKDADCLREALDAGDFEAIRRLGHQIKGVGGGYGFDKITEIGCSLEQAAKEQAAEAVRRRIVELVGYLQNVEVVHE